MSAIGAAGGNLLDSLTPVAAAAVGYKSDPATGTGILPFINWSRAQGLLKPETVGAVVPDLPGLFGGYPFPPNQATEIGPDALFIALFAILFLACLFVWLMDLRRGHGFFMLLGVAFFCALKVVGFACRLAWSNDVTQVKVSIASVVFIQVAQLILEALNLLLSHRVLTWRHPEIGRFWPLVTYINTTYFLVLGVIAMAIVGQTLPYLYFLTEHNYMLCKNVFQAAAVLNLVFAAIPFQFLLFAYTLKPGTIINMPRVLNFLNIKQDNLMPAVYQPTWIKSAGIFYYPAKHSQIPVYRGEPGSDAVRIMSSREPPGHNHRQHGGPMHPDAPRMKLAVFTVIFTSLILLFDTCFRVAAVFRTGAYGTATATGIKINFWAHHPYVMFIFYGAFEVVVIAFYLLMRIDLRFYIPDMAKSVPKGGIPAWAAASHADDEPITWTGVSDNLSKKYSGSVEHSP